MGIDEKRRNLETELTRYVLAIADLQDAARGARYLAEAPWLELSPPVRRCLITGTFTSYWRPFTNKGCRALPKPDLSEDQTRVHNWAGKRRNRIWAHATPGATRKVEIDAATRTTPGSIRIKSKPPMKREYLALAELAEHLIEQYQTVVDEIESPSELPPRARRSRRAVAVIDDHGRRHHAALAALRDMAARANGAPARRLAQ